MITLSLRHTYPGATIDLAFAAPTPGTTVLFGPSGAGKSTAVAAIAGLLRPDRIHLSIDGTVLADTGHRVWTPPEQRRIGLVFQDARLFPHMNVEANLRYGQRRAGPGPIAFDDVTALLGLAPLLAQRPHTLSGGEKQRVAIGRALLSQPRLLLMDEPLAGLDDARKAEILPFLLRLTAQRALPIVYVTHSMAEVARLADTVVLIEAGKVTASGSLAEISGRSTLPLAARDDAAAVLALDVAAHDEHRRLTRLQAPGITLLVPLLDDRSARTVRVRIPARDLIVATEAPSAISVQNTLPGHIRQMTPDAGHHQMLVEIEVGSATLLARLTADAAERLDLHQGSAVFALIKSSAIEVL